MLPYAVYELFQGISRYIFMYSISFAAICVGLLCLKYFKK